MDGKKRPTIAIMLGNTQSEYSEELISGFHICAQEEGVNLVFLMGPQMSQDCVEILSDSFSWNFNYQFHTIYDYVHFIKPDAIIVAYGSLAASKSVSDRKEFLERYYGIPCLLLGDIEQELEIPYLVAGNYDGMRACINHLIVDHGYREIGFVGGPERNYDSNERLRAYRDVLAEHGIEIRDERIVHGNYTEYVDAEVEYLLDCNPDLEAIAFANDDMAKAGYRVCAARGLLVGHDIAITGFDDMDIAKSMDPPLTSVLHSSFLFSHEALQMALKLCRGEKPVSRKMEAFFHKRASCGCRMVFERMTNDHLPDVKLHSYIERRVANITEELFSSLPYEREKTSFYEQMMDYFDYILVTVFEQNGASFSNKQLLRYIKRLCSYQNISKYELLEFLSVLFEEMIEYVESDNLRLQLGTIILSVQQYIHSVEVMELKTRLRDEARQLWFVPSFAMDLFNANHGFEKNMYSIMKRLVALKVRSTYFFFFEEPLYCYEGKELQFPERLYLLAFYNDREMVCYKEDEGIPITTEKGINEVLLKDEARFYTAFVLFSGNVQYGLMLCEVEQKDRPFTLVCSQQIGSLRRVVLMNVLEQQMKQELEEKNRILNFISESDELTGVLNRRGFMEQAIRELAERRNEQAFLIFADVDHLKEINDCFGHAAGDFAICTAAGYLQSCLPGNALVARIGGDEFVALVFSDDNSYRDKLFSELKAHAKSFNESCEQPFYVEISVGIYAFVNDGADELQDLLRQSDKVLYQDKAMRKKSIKKTIMS